MKKLAIDGIEVGVADDKADELTKKLEEVGVQVVDLEESRPKVTYEPYGFETFLKKAKHYSESNPVDAEQYLFWKLASDAATMCIKEYYLTRFGVLILTHTAKDELLDSICAGLNGEQGGRIGEIWTEIEQLNENFYEKEFAPKFKREESLKLIEELADIIEQADVELVKADFESLQSISLRDVPEQKFTIGETSYPYTHLAY